jgi:hypothetical protein
MILSTVALNIFRVACIYIYGQLVTVRNHLLCVATACRLVNLNDAYNKSFYKAHAGSLRTYWFL